MIEFSKERFVQLLHEVPEKKQLLSEPQYSPYIQSLIDIFKKEGNLPLDVIDWSAFEMEDVTPKSCQSEIENISKGWIEGFSRKIQRMPTLHLRCRTFF